MGTENNNEEKLDPSQKLEDGQQQEEQQEPAFEDVMDEIMVEQGILPAAVDEPEEDAGEEPSEPEPEVDEKEEESSAPVKSKEEPDKDTDDWLSELKDTQKERVEELLQKLSLLEHKEKSFSGRHKFYTERLATLNKTIEELKQNQQPPKAPSVKDLLKDDEEYNASREELPEVAKQIEKAVDAATQLQHKTQYDARNQQLQQQQEQLARQAEEEQTAILDQAVPWWKEHVLDETGKQPRASWEAFVEQLPSERKALATSDFAADIIDLMYTDYVPWANQMAASQEPADLGDTKVTEDQAASAKKIEERRKQKVQDTAPAAGNSRARTPQPHASTDDQDSWDRDLELAIKQYERISNTR